MVVPLVSRLSRLFTHSVRFFLVPFPLSMLTILPWSTVRTHPVTGRKSLSIHLAHAQRIHNYKKEESDYLYNFLNDVLVKGGDFQARVKYEEGTVAVWDKCVEPFLFSSPSLGFPRQVC